MLYQNAIGVNSQRKFYRVFRTSFPEKPLLSRSRFNRRSRQLLPVLAMMRHRLVKISEPRADIAIIDSFPTPYQCYIDGTSQKFSRILQMSVKIRQRT